MKAFSPIRATSTLVEPSTCPPSSCPGHYPRPWATTGTLSPWALLPVGDPVVVCLVRSTFRASVRPLPLLIAGCVLAGRSRGAPHTPREAGIRVSASFPAVTEHTHWNWSSSNPALPMRGLTRERLSTLDAGSHVASSACYCPLAPFG